MSKLSLQVSLLECVRSDLQLSVKDFCSRLSLSESDYTAFLHSNSLRNFPPRSLGHLRELMLEMERKNLDMFRTQAEAKTKSYFLSSKILLHMDKVTDLQGSSPEQVGPITIELHPSNICNHRCPSCTFNTPDRQTRDGEKWTSIFDIDLLDPLIEDMNELGVCGVCLSGGGEPMLHPDLDTIIRKIYAAGIDVALITNGSLLYKDTDVARRTIAAIVDCCTFIRISADAGSQQSYETMHGKASAVNFENLLRGIQKLGQTKLDKNSDVTIGISYLLTPNNYLELIPAIIEMREIPGLDYFQVKPMEVPPIQRGISLDMIYWDRRIFDTLVMLAAYERPGFSIHTPGFKFIDILQSETDGLPFSRCWCHPFYPTVCADGTVIVCCHMIDYGFDGNDIGVYGKLSKNRRLIDLWRDPRRYTIGSNITVRMCPANCKLASANKMLDSIYSSAPHSSFLS